MPLYRIVRKFFHRVRARKTTIRAYLTLEEAQAHCHEPETSSSTCKSPRMVAYTKKHGPWFDSYEEMP